MQRSNPEGDPVLIWTGESMLDGRLITPTGRNRSVVVIASLGGTAHHSGYRRMASRFASEGFMVLLADLFTPDEQQIDSRTGHYRADVPLLCERMRDIVSWLRRETRESLDVVLFATGVAAAAAISVAADHPALISALVLAAPRVEIVEHAMKRIRIPALLLVPESDPGMLASTRRASADVGPEVQLVVLHDAGNVIEDDNAVNAIIDRAVDWTYQTAAASRHKELLMHS
jgi:dienelactone hydrolase